MFPIRRSDVWVAALAQCGLPYVHKGRVDSADCVGVIVNAARAVGSPLRDEADYPREATDLIERFIQAGCVQDANGSVAIIKMRGCPTHAAIINGDRMVHVVERPARVTEVTVTDRWRSRIVARLELPWVH